jgi:hypothetical protein
MPIDDEGRYYRGTSGPPTPARKQGGQARSVSSRPADQEDGGCLEAVIWIIVFLVGLAAIGFGLYATWLGLVWAYGFAVKVFNFIYEFKEVVVGLIVWIVFGFFRSLFD